TALESTVDVDAIVRLAGGGLDFGFRISDFGFQTHCRVAVARDAAFCFYYQDNLDLLQDAGAEVVSFSPLGDSCLPGNVDLVYLGGGYPELHAERLASNRDMTAALRRHHERGGAIYAECGGLMYCCRELTDADGCTFPMLDLLPARTVMQKSLAALG